MLDKLLTLVCKAGVTTLATSLEPLVVFKMCLNLFYRYHLITFMEGVPFYLDKLQDFSTLVPLTIPNNMYVINIYSLSKIKAIFGQLPISFLVHFPCQQPPTEQAKLQKLFPNQKLWHLPSLIYPKMSQIANLIPKFSHTKNLACEGSLTLYCFLSN